MTDRPSLWQHIASVGPVTWKARHFWVVVLAILGIWAFTASRAEWSPMHRWNRATGDTSLVLVSLAMLVGPTARLWPWMRRFLPWRRELGVWGTLLAIVHTLIILDGWVQWDLIRLFGYEFHPLLDQYVMIQHGFGLANVVGIVALVYGIVLAVTSNDLSQKFLGGTVWKFLQQSAYVLWALIVMHTAYFLYMHFQDFHRQVPDPNWLQMPFAGLVVLVGSFQALAFLRTWKLRRRGRVSASLG